MDALHMSAGRWTDRGESGLNGLYVSERSYIFFIRDSQLLLFTQEKNLIGSSEPIFKSMLVIENEMGLTGLKPILFNKLLLTVSNWF